MEKVTFGECPKCKEGKILNKTNLFSCTKENCDWIIFKDFFGINIEADLFEEILNGGEEGHNITITDAAGNKYESTMYYNTEYHKLHLEQIGDNAILKDVNCPDCGGKIERNFKGYFCENSHPQIQESERCQIKIYNPIASKTITDKIARELLEGKTTERISGFKSISKGGKPFSAKLYIDEGTKQVKFDFHIGNCPLCNGELVENEKAFGCAEWKKGCKFTIWKEQFGVVLKIGDLEDILNTGATKEKTITSKDKKEKYKRKIYFNKEKLKTELI